MGLSAAEFIRESVAPATRIALRYDVVSVPKTSSGKLTESQLDAAMHIFGTGASESLPPQALARPTEIMPITRIDHKGRDEHGKIVTIWSEEVEPHDAMMATLRHRKQLDRVLDRTVTEPRRIKVLPK